jgi:L-ribulose-5-phosphate 3-epimerase
MKRRQFLLRSLAAAGGLGASSLPGRLGASPPLPRPVEPGMVPPPPFQISLAEWALEKTLHEKKLDHLDFPRLARQLQILTVEYVDQFFSDKAKDAAYLAELKKRCEGEGVRSGLIMVDTAGRLADPDAAKRTEAVEKHRGWLEAAKALGCHSMRVNAWGDGSPDDLLKRMAESGARLAEEGQKLGLNVIVENHGGPSSDPAWMVALCRQVGSPWFGTLPDFGNFPAATDPFEAVGAMMPFARGVSAKYPRRNPSEIGRMMKIVLDAGFRGYVGIESHAERSDGEQAAIRTMREDLEKVRGAQPVLKPLWNGRDLAGWAKVEGGEWTVEGGELVGRNGQNWSTDPSRTGSWLRTEKEYGDFELYLEFNIGPGTNSGVFIRSGLERNPAFTGYEVQIVDAAGKPPTKGGPGSLYDYAAPRKNLIRPAGEWNQLRVIARGPSIRVHLNGELNLDAQGDRRPKGFIGLQAHDARSVVKFRDISIAEI